MDLDDKWKKAMNKSGVSQKELEDNIILKTKKEINSEIIEATNIILKTERHNYVDVNGIIFLQEKE